MLKQLLIKDWKNTENPEVRNRYGHVAGGFGIFTNFLLGAVKLFVGLISNSVSIMADAVNNIFDMITSILTIVGFKLSSRKPDREHPYGHARYEYVSGFVIAVFMFEMGILFAKESITKIINPEELVLNFTTYLILGCAIVGKLIQMFVYKDFSKAIGSKTLEANATDTRNDIISSSAILVSMIVMGVFKINLDGYIGLAVSVFVIISSIDTMKEELEPIIGIVPTQEQVKVITEKLMSYEICKGIHDLVIHNYGVHNDFITVHVEVDSKLDINYVHDKVDNIEADFKKEGMALTIHMDPIELGNPILDDYKEQVRKLLQEKDPEIKFHDFRMVRGDSHTNLIFDCVIPHEKSYTQDELGNYLKKNINTDENLFFVIEIDRDFC